MSDPDDLILWPDGTTCLRRELGEYEWMSDDYECIPFDSPRWDELNGNGVVDGFHIRAGGIWPDQR